MIASVIFTFPPDYLSASYAARMLQKVGTRPFLAIDKADPELHVNGVDIIRTNFNRVGNLNGADCVRGILDVYAKVGDIVGGDYVLKVDSDTAVLSLDWLKGRDETVVGLSSSGIPKATRKLYGLCYAVRRDSIEDLSRAAEGLTDPSCFEDVTIGTLAEKVGKLFTWDSMAKEAPMVSFGWEKHDPKTLAKKYGVVLVQRTRTFGRRHVSDVMKQFLNLSDDVALSDQ